MEQPLVTIIIPVYNVESYLSECLDSLLNQDYKRIEIIAVNDGSTDKSLIILEYYRDFFENYIIINQANRGLSMARNSGLKYVTGKYTYFLDSDDYILSSTIANLVSLSEENNLDLIRFNATPFLDGNKDMEIIEKKYENIKFCNCDKIYNNRDFLEINTNNISVFQAPVWLYFIKTEIIKKNNLTFIQGLLHEDEYFTPYVLKYSNRIMFDKTPYFQRRYREGSIMHNINLSTKSFESKLKIIELFGKERDSNLSFQKFINKRQQLLYISLFPYVIDEKLKKEGIREIRKDLICNKFFLDINIKIINSKKKIKRYLNYFFKYKKGNSL